MLYDLSKLPLVTQQAIEKDYFKLFSTFPDRLFSIGADTKTVKGQELDVLTGIVYLSPYKISGGSHFP